MALNWQCPHCERHVTIGEADRSDSGHTLHKKNAQGQLTLYTTFFVCPNETCREPTLIARLCETQITRGYERIIKQHAQWRLIPFGAAKTYPDYIPVSLRNDYVEACRIVDLSPKAAATLCRRVLQGMIRDYWEVDTKSRRLWDEIKAIEDKVDAGTWGAIVALKDIGNIGAHMESDVEMIVDVEPDEASLLIELIESLFEEWYINREERKQRNAKLKAAAAAKKCEPTPPNQPNSSTLLT
jgi:hypothetical protein